MSLSNERSSIESQSTVATGSPALRYGMTESFVINRPHRSIATKPISASKKLKFLLGEVTGLLFIVLSTLYVFVMPASLTQAGGLKAVMNRTLKRTLDIVGATVGLLLAAPLMLLAAVLVKLDSPGPAFYTQVRVGVNRRKQGRRYSQHVGVGERRARDRRRTDYLGMPFKMIKFRTMIQDAEKKSGPVWATQNDPRITRLGMFLRKTRIDEIPQFLSILKGDMSLVGPRPERPSFVRELCTKVDDYHHRLDVKPGLTGLAQVENGYDSSLASVAEKVKFDLTYIRGWSLWADIRILLKTVVVVVTGRGAC
jgi:lipopolysaccharide/colanic/teichoic acid biosynthesis glycosyltransferase